MTTKELAEARSSVTTEQRQIIDRIWTYHTLHEQRRWPKKRSILARFGKTAALDALARLPRGTVVEVSGPPMCYALSLLGVLLTSDGTRHEDLLVDYLRFVRTRIEADPDISEVDGAEVERALEISNEESYLLGDLVSLSHLWGEHYAPGPPWKCGVPENIEEFPEIEDFHAYLWERARRDAESAARMQDSIRRPRAQRSTFWFVEDAALRKLLERDFEELRSIERDRPIKSTIILCGGILEGMLLGVLRGRLEEAVDSYGRLGKGPTKPLEEWRLNDLVDVAKDLGLLSRGSASLSHAVREFRNLIHPAVQLRENLLLSTEEAIVARSALAIFIRDLEASLPLTSASRVEAKTDR